MKRNSLTKCLQLAHNYNDQEVIDFITSKYRTAKIVEAQINIPPAPDGSANALYNISIVLGKNNTSGIMSRFMSTFPHDPLVSNSDFENIVRKKLDHVEIYHQFINDLNDNNVLIRQRAAEEYAIIYKSKIDPTWEIGSSDVGKDVVKSDYYIHDYIKEIMTNWYSSLYPDVQKKVKGEPSRDFFAWWDDLPSAYTDDTYVQNALNASHTVYYEPLSGSYASVNLNKIIKTSDNTQKDNPYSRMNKITESLYNFGLRKNEFPYFEHKMNYNGKDVTFYNPEKQKLTELIIALQKALVGETKEEDEKRNKQEQDISGPFDFLTNLMTYKGGRI